MRRFVAVTLVLVVMATWAGADWVCLSDFDHGVIPHEFHKNIPSPYLTTKHAAPGHVALCLQPVGPGWVTDYHLWHNWTWYDRIVFQLFNENDQPVTIQYEIRTHNGRRGTMNFVVQPGANDVVLKLADFKSIAEKPFDLWDVGQWVLFFDRALPKPVYLSDYRLIRENIQLPAPNEARIAAQFQAQDAEIVSVKEEGDPVPVYWGAMTFAAGKTASVWIDLLAGEKNFNTFTFPAMWLGYEKLTLRCDNPQAAPVKFQLVLEDLVARACAKTEQYEGQLVVVPLEAAPGRSALAVDLTGLKTVDGGRAISLSQMSRVGFRVVNPERGTKLSVSDLRVHTTSEMAGVLVPTEGARLCARCNNRLDDRNCIVCPFCGRLYNEHAVVTEPAPNSIKLMPVKNGIATATSGGGQPTVTQRAEADQLDIHHYDGSFWECRTFLRFDPSALNVDAKRIRKAELRLHSANTGNQGKAWLCPMYIFTSPDALGDFDEARLSWITQPPIGGFASQGGLYYYWTDQVAIDMTQFVRDRLGRSQEPFTLILKAFEAEEVKADAHKFGHHFPFYSRRAPDESKRPYLYIELE